MKTFARACVRFWYDGGREEQVEGTERRSRGGGGDVSK